MSADVNVLVQAVNALSDDAVYLASCDWFSRTIAGQPVLAAARDDRQEAAFSELLRAGFAYLDTEREIVGYRSTERGRIASSICRHAIGAA